MIGTDFDSSEPEGGDFEEAFKKAYKTEFGFLLTSQIVVDDVKVSLRVPRYMTTDQKLMSV